MKKKILSLLLIIVALSNMTPPAFAQAATTSASDVASPSASASSSGAISSPVPSFSSQDGQNPFSDSGLTEQNSQTQIPSITSLLNTSLGGTNSAGSALIKQKSVIHELVKKNFKSDEAIQLTVNNATSGTVAVSVTDWEGKQIDSSLIDKTTVDGQTTISINPPKFNFRPGKYTIHIVDADGTTSTQDFTWGVLAMNMDKSIYLPNETSQISIAVLDEKGDMVCNANVSLEITDPAGNQTLLSTGTHTITVNSQCQTHAFSLVPDYQTSYQVGKSGKYGMSLSATTKNGTNTISDNLIVTDAVPFDVTRTSATRIYPINSYPMIFHIKANQDFTGTISDSVPSNFVITPYATGSAKTYDASQLVTPVPDMQESFGTSYLSIGKPFAGNFPQTQGFGVALTDPQEKKLYAAFGLAGHDGLDFAVPQETPVLATDDGTVSLAGNGAYGTTIVIDHPWGKSYYGHLSKLEVKVGDKVTKGQEIALSGDTGMSTGPHLHFGIKPLHPDMQNGYYGKVDPTPYLSFLTQSTNVLAASTTTASDQSHQVISWHVSLKKGDVIDLAYSYKAPNISPELYSTGPLTFQTSLTSQTIFSEQRQWQIAVDAAPTAVHTLGADTAIGTSTTLVSQSTSFAASTANIIIATVALHNTVNVGSAGIAAHGLILERGSTNIADNVNPISFGPTGSAPKSDETYNFLYVDTPPSGSPTYNIVATSAGSINATAEIVVINGMPQTAFTNGSNTTLTASDTTLATATMTASGDNVIIADVQLYNSNASGAKVISAGNVKIKNNAGTTIASTAYEYNINPDSGVNNAQDQAILIARESGAAASQTYTVTGLQGGGGVDGQARLLVLSGVDSAFADGGATTLTTSGSDNTVTSLSTSFAAGNNVIFSGNQLHGISGSPAVALGGQILKDNTTLLTSSPYKLDMGTNTTVSETKGSGLIYLENAGASPTYNVTDNPNGASNTGGDAQTIAFSLAPPTYTQATYRLLANADSVTAGAALAALNTPYTLTNVSQAFRLRMTINVGSNQLALSGENFKLQYVDRGTGTCAAPSGGTPSTYTDVTSSTLIAYHNNPTPADGATLGTTGSDPTDGGITINAETYDEANNFTNSVIRIPNGEDGMWDFSLIDNTGGNGKTYCFRAVYSDGTTFNSYTNYPQITVATSGPTLDQLLRHGEWFNNGVSQPFTF